MNKKLKISLNFVIFLTLSACSTTRVVEEKTVLPVVPKYVKVPHPSGFDQADLKAIFASTLAPKAALGEFADTCDEEFRKLLTLTNSREEHKKGAIELVTEDPERMHWCFYSKIVRLQGILQSDSTWSLRQKKVIESFEFLSPIASAFLECFHDSRYLRWATQYYTKVSEWVFFKKLNPTPENTLLLTNETRTDLEPWVQVDKSEPRHDSVYTKYGISFMPSVAGAINPFETATEASRVPASAKEAIEHGEGSLETAPAAP